MKLITVYFDLETYEEMITYKKKYYPYFKNTEFIKL